MSPSIGNSSANPAASPHVSIERWAAVKGYGDFYEVSDFGRVRSLRRKQPKLLRPGRTSTGHLTVSLGRRSTRTVHTLVMEAFVGPAPPGLEVRHLDGNPENNALGNLAYGTRRQNIEDRKWHRTTRGYHKLFGAEAREIKARLATGARGVDLAREFGVSDTVVSDIKWGRIHCDA